MIFNRLENVQKAIYVKINKFNSWIFFSIRVFFHRHSQLTGQQGKGGTIFHSTRSRKFRHLQFSTWDDYHIFLIATLVFTRLLLDEIYHLTNYHLTDWWCNVDFRLFAFWFDFRFCYSYFFTWETGGLELASTIILVLQANRLTKCARRLTKCARHLLNDSRRRNCFKIRKLF